MPSNTASDSITVDSAKPRSRPFPPSACCEVNDFSLRVTHGSNGRAGWSSLRFQPEHCLSSFFRRYNRDDTWNREFITCVCVGRLSHGGDMEQHPPGTTGHCPTHTCAYAWCSVKPAHVQWMYSTNRAVGCAPPKQSNEPNECMWIEFLQYNCIIKWPWVGRFTNASAAVCF